ncbi:MAG: hypothetical protein ACW964_15880, partial [Candidatus Hodarchaeales archaeon]
GLGFQPAFANIIDNSPPGAPTIDGPNVGTIWQTYWYNFNAVDPDGDDVRFYITWGDCTYNVTDYVPSGTDKTVTHTWDDFGTFIIKAFAIDSEGNIGPESEFPVGIPRDKQEDCNCQTVVNNVEFDRLDKVTGIKDLLNRNLKQSEFDYPPFIICGYVGIRFILAFALAFNCYSQMESYNESGNTFLYEFFKQLTLIFLERAVYFLIMGEYNDCYWANFWDDEIDMI